MNPTDYQFIGDMLKRRSGMLLAPGKEYLLESRLMPIVRESGLGSLEVLTAELRKPGSEALQAKVTEAMTTNETFFFRDTSPFDLFRDDLVPAMLQSRAADRRLRIWCAACSTGQEPYSLAMILREMADRLVNWQIEIVATDLNSEVLEKAKVGMYSQFEVQRGMPIALLVKYFTQIGEMWQIDADIRAMVKYKKLNLLEPFSELGRFDIVFCRNVLIYFDQMTKREILERIGAVMSSDGCLLLGAAETVLGITDAFRPVPEKRGLYTTPPSGVAASGPDSGVPALRAI